MSFVACHTLFNLRCEQIVEYMDAIIPVNRQSRRNATRLTTFIKACLIAHSNFFLPVNFRTKINNNSNIKKTRELDALNIKYNKQFPSASLTLHLYHVVNYCSSVHSIFSFVHLLRALTVCIEWWLKMLLNILGSIYVYRIMLCASVDAASGFFCIKKKLFAVQCSIYILIAKQFYCLRLAYVRWSYFTEGKLKTIWRCI